MFVEHGAPLALPLDAMRLVAIALFMKASGASIVNLCLNVGDGVQALEVLEVRAAAEVEDAFGQSVMKSSVVSVFRSRMKIVMTGEGRNGRQYKGLPKSKTSMQKCLP